LPHSAERSRNRDRHRSRKAGRIPASAPGIVIAIDGGKPAAFKAQLTD
jgi:hypothetical protein